MPYQVRYQPRHDYVLVEIDGQPSIDEFLVALQEIGAASVGWAQKNVVVDLRPVARDYSFTEQLRIGQSVARNLGHLDHAAAIVQPERITRVGEKAAHHSGATQVSVFASEADAAAWIRGEAAP
jgi:hypothetical protein